MVRVLERVPSAAVKKTRHATPCPARRDHAKVPSSDTNTGRPRSKDRLVRDDQGVITAPDSSPLTAPETLIQLPERDPVMEMRADPAAVGVT